MVQLSDESARELIALQASKGILLEGSILNYINPTTNGLIKYIEEAKKEDKIQVGKRLEISQKLLEEQDKNRKHLQQLVNKEKELQDLLSNTKDKLEVELARKKNETLSVIISYFLYCIIGILIVASLLYIGTVLLSRTSTVMENLVSGLYMLAIGQCFGFIAAVYGVKKDNNNGINEK
jgi:hypothetical protein